MDDDLASWLALREPADTAARSADLTRTIVGMLPSEDPVHVLDLATGTGANIRYLAGHLPRHQRWLVIDRDEALLAQLPVRTASWAAAQGYEVQNDRNGLVIRGERLECHVEARRLDLGSLEDLGIFADRHLVTASALLDLVSERWMGALAERCGAVGAATLFAITYNGSSSCTPVEPEDEMIRDLLNRHQKTDKGLGGPAAGPHAAECAVGCFEGIGYRVQSEPSDWVLGPADYGLQRRLVEGWGLAATEIAPERAALVASWRYRRLAHIKAERSRVVVGHHDVAAWPRTSW